MSSRNEEYERFLDAWDEWTDNINNMSVLTSENDPVNVGQELARLLKVITYLNASITSIDSELVPLNLWTECANYCVSYKPNIEAAISSQTEATIIAANANADNLLVILSPYIQDSLSKLKALKPAFNTHLKHINTQLEAYDKKSSILIQELEDKKSQSSEAYNEILAYKDSLCELHTEFLIGMDEEPSLQKKLQELEATIDKQYTKINEFYQTLITNEDSIKFKVDTAEKLVTDSSIEIKTVLNELDKELKELDDFHKKIFGKLNEQGEIDNGLKFEINERKDALDLMKVKQQSQYDALKKQIEGLIPGATSVGLATAYHDLSISFDKPIKKNTNLFFCSIATIILISILLTIDRVELTTLTLEFIELNNLKDVGRFLLQRLPIVLPAIWLAIFASKRRSEAERLKQEYAHKEALAKSYQSFKFQIEELDSDNKEPLLEKLLYVAIDTISTNASSTLDKKHGDNAPLIGIFDKTIDKLPSIKSKE